MSRYIIFAGVNGAGKSTLYHTSAYERLPRISTDEMVQREGDWKNTHLQMQMGKEAVKRIKEYFEKDISFNQETTLCGRSIMKNIQKAKKLGYSVEMYYVGVENAQIAINRVENRVKNGGHGIPEEIIKERYFQSMENLIKVISLCDKVKIYDNTEQFVEFAGYENGKAVFLEKDTMPKWFEQYILSKLEEGKE